MPAPRHVVLGAGPAGRALVERLHAAAESVRVVTRSGAARVPDGVEVVAANVADPEAARRACAGAAVVYGCVGMDYRDWPNRWPPLLGGMLAGAEAAGARFVFLDNVYMYGPTDSVLREDLPLTDYGVKPATRARLTRLWQEAHASGRVRAVAVRASDFYGPGVSLAMLGELTLGRIAHGKPALCLGRIDLPHSFAYVPDVARVLAAIGTAEDDVLGQAWHVPNAPDRTVRELLELFARLAGRELRVRVLPKLALRAMALFSANLREMLELSYQWERPFHVDGSKAERRLGITATPFEEGLAATAAVYARGG